MPSSALIGGFKSSCRLRALFLFVEFPALLESPQGFCGKTGATRKLRLAVILFENHLPGSPVVIVGKKGMSGLNDLDEALKAIRADYFASLEGRYEGIARDWNNLMQEENDAGALGDLIRRVHNLVGSGALYGLEELSDTARSFEFFLSEQNHFTSGANGEAAEQGLALLGRLRTAMLHPRHEENSLRF